MRRKIKRPTPEEYVYTPEEQERIAAALADLQGIERDVCSSKAVLREALTRASELTPRQGHVLYSRAKRRRLDDKRRLRDALFTYYHSVEGPPAWARLGAAMTAAITARLGQEPLIPKLLLRPRCKCECPNGHCEHIWDGSWKILEREIRCPAMECVDSLVSATCSRCGVAKVLHDSHVEKKS